MKPTCASIISRFHNGGLFWDCAGSRMMNIYEENLETCILCRTGTGKGDRYYVRPDVKSIAGYLLSKRFHDIWRICSTSYRQNQLQRRLFQRSRFAAVRAKSFSRSDRSKQTTWHWWKTISVIVENLDLQLGASRLRKKLALSVILVLLKAVPCHRHVETQTYSATYHRLQVALPLILLYRTTTHLHLK